MLEQLINIAFMCTGLLYAIYLTWLQNVQILAINVTSPKESFYMIGILEALEFQLRSVELSHKYTLTNGHIFEMIYVMNDIYILSRFKRLSLEGWQSV